MKSINKAKAIDFAILVLRWYLSFYMISYGWSKIMGNQFGVFNSEILNQPLQEVDKFYVAWHLFGSDLTFNIVGGIVEIIGGLLIIYNRTTIVGALFLLPVLFQIFLIDLSFTTNIFGAALPVRTGGMMICDFIILYYYKDKIIAFFNHITDGISTRFKYRWWIYLILPILGFLTDFIIAIITYPIKILFR